MLDENGNVVPTCRFTWPVDRYLESSVYHSCILRAGHIDKHECSCGVSHDNA